MKSRDSIEDICDEFGVTSEFVEFVWAILNNVQLGGGISLRDLPPLGAFKPRTKRECALACVIALSRMNK